MNDNGFISISVIYAFLILFILLMLGIIGSYITRNNLLVNLIQEAKTGIYGGNLEEGDIVLKTYINGEFSPNLPTDYVKYMFDPSGTYCVEGSNIIFDSNTKKVNVTNIINNELCNVSFVSKGETHLLIYANDIPVSFIPSKNSGYIFDDVNSRCLEGNTVTFDTNLWEVRINNISNTNTVCTVYFKRN